MWKEAEKNGSWKQFHDSVRREEQFREWSRQEVLPYDDETGSQSMYVVADWM